MDLLEKTVALEKAAEEFGLRWSVPEQIMEQIESECEEIHEHLKHGLGQVDSPQLQEEIGDLLHAVLSLCVFCKFKPQETLQLALDKFERRLNAVKSLAQEQGLADLDGHTFDELMKFWKEAKQKSWMNFRIYLIYDFCFFCTQPGLGSSFSSRLV